MRHFFDWPNCNESNQAPGNIGHVLDHMIKKPTNRDRLCGDRIVGFIAIGF
ncbi:predicted protein [Sclerotinia sclerotiorum 1980 UF-70]|uniref:Uncharacterized protein n=1 Tax=Sclerotinia sclerotiorum (strain ATCC 18683 / 1980 / Ss-1) TaxID=665079 RepID=A7EMB8_SCLS1|nr:predicted protein [Sclerotinia sclerotiorum 1980 UF-70]EDO03984.1 predicted protein [Sclerotinia sclerotiorum 1980 UF-70]